MLPLAPAVTQGHPQSDWLLAAIGHSDLVRLVTSGRWHYVGSGLRIARRCGVGLRRGVVLGILVRYVRGGSQQGLGRLKRGRQDRVVIEDANVRKGAVAELEHQIQPQIAIVEPTPALESHHQLLGVNERTPGVTLAIAA